jgi:hypothetical protein
MHVMTRDVVPPLTDVAEWAKFPFQDYDLVVIDSLDSSAEGVGEKDSSRPSRAIAPLLDIAHRANGPSILVLGNTIKNGVHSRGSGVVEDRADICYEVRDATGFVPTGEKSWWEELPAAGADAWAQRSSRRQQRDCYRLAGVQVRESAAQNKAEQISQAVAALARFVQQEVSQGKEVLLDRDAVEFLSKRGFKRSQSRSAIEHYNGQFWRIKVFDNRRGRPKALIPITANASQKSKMAAEISQSETLQPSITCKPPISADPVNIERRKSDCLEPAPAEGSSHDRLFPPTSTEHPGWSEKI